MHRIIQLTNMSNIQKSRDFLGLNARGVRLNTSFWISVIPIQSKFTSWRKNLSHFFALQSILANFKQDSTFFNP